MAELARPFAYDPQIYPLLSAITETRLQMLADDSFGELQGLHV